jgi:hypothetical protein
MIYAATNKNYLQNIPFVHTIVSLYVSILSRYYGYGWNNVLEAGETWLNGKSSLKMEKRSDSG